LALTWKWYLRLADRGKHAIDFVTTLAFYAARSVGSGRRLCCREKPNDVLSPLAQRQHGFAVSSIPNRRSAFDEALHDNVHSAVIDQVAFRCDFPAWRHTRSERDRRLIDELMIGERPRDVARRHGLSLGRVSQLRGEFYSDWEKFSNGQEPDGGSQALAS
jgi:hypothetical protein